MQNSTHGSAIECTFVCPSGNVKNSIGSTGLDGEGRAWTGKG